jgi:proteasome lid subunit RPN8/RPN11
MFSTIKRLLSRPGAGESGTRIIRRPPQLHVIIPDRCLDDMRVCMTPEIKRGHEGIAFFLGRTDGTTTVIVSVMRPEARTSRGSFAVSSTAMAKVVEKACGYGLQVVGQVHSHPTLAGHSQGDEDGARIAYDGFVSLVIPNYGRDLPSLSGTAAYMFRGGEFEELNNSAVTVVPMMVP